MSYVAAVSCLPLIGPLLRPANKYIYESFDLLDQVTDQITTNETPAHKQIYQYALYQLYCKAPCDFHGYNKLAREHPNYLTDVLLSPDAYHTVFLDQKNQATIENATRLLNRGIDLLNQRKPLVICGLIGHILTIASLVSLIATGILTGHFRTLIIALYTFRSLYAMGLVLSWLTVNTARTEASTFFHKDLAPPAFQIPEPSTPNNPRRAPV